MFRTLVASETPHLPVIGGEPVGSPIFVEEGHKTIDAPAGAEFVSIEALQGVGYVLLAAEGTETIPDPWPPNADDTNAAAWLALENGTASQIREFAVRDGDRFRLYVSSGAQVQFVFL